MANANRCVRNSEKKKRATQQKTPQRKSFVNRVALDTEADTEPASREKTSASFEGGRTRGPAGGGTLKEASWRARARQVPFLRPLWEGSPSQTRPTRAAHMRARVARGASEPTANIACRAYSCTARRRGSPTKATEWRQASRAFREPRSAAHDCRGPVPPQSRNMSRAKHGSAAARQRTPSDFRAAATVPCSGRRPVAPDGRVHTVLVRLAGASTAYLRGGCEDRAERGAVGAAATAAERGAQAVVAERGRVARGSRCARKRALAAHHERAQTDRRGRHRRTAWQRGRAR